MTHLSSASLAVVLLAGAGLAACVAGAEPEPPPERPLAFHGPADGALLNAEEVDDLMFAVAGDPDQLDGVVVLLNDEDVTAEVESKDARLVYAPSDLDDGEHTVAVGRRTETDGNPDPGLEPLHEWTFQVDATAPEIELTAPESAVIAGEPVTVAGATEPGAVVEVAGATTTAEDDGAFELVLDLDEAPDGPLALSATDEAGNTTRDEVALTVVPSRVEVDEVRAVHVSFCGWATPSLREPVLQHIENGLINAVQLDLKDETGKVGYDTNVEMAALVGADEPDCLIDLDAAVEQLHGLGVAVIGRIVAFADPTLAPWAWDNGERDWVVQTADGDMYTGRYAGFANFADPDVVEYNLAVAEEAAAAGVDHILWDYIRKPDGPLEGMHFPGLDVTPEEGIAEFARLADERLEPYGVVHGASLYGISADRPTEVAQDVSALADHVDYVAPMVYPSHWGPGEYGVADPLRQPGEMVTATLEKWFEATDGKRARVLPWLEDSNWPVRLGFSDRDRYVREQIQATFDAGIAEWLLWDPSVRYTTSAMLQP